MGITSFASWQTLQIESLAYFCCRKIYRNKAKKSEENLYSIVHTMQYIDLFDLIRPLLTYYLQFSDREHATATVNVYFDGFLSVVVVVVTVLVMVALAVVVAGCGGDNDGNDAGGTDVLTSVLSIFCMFDVSFL